MLKVSDPRPSDNKYHHLVPRPSTLLGPRERLDRKVNNVLETEANCPVAEPQNTPWTLMGLVLMFRLFSGGYT